MKRSYVRLPRLAFFLAAATFGAFTARAATVTWDTSTLAGFQAGNGTWGTDAFWTTDGSVLTTWTAGDSAEFRGDTTPVTNTITLNTTQTVDGLIFGGATTSGTWTLAGTSNLILSKSATVLVNAGSTVTIGNVLAGSSGLTKTGAGTLVLTNAATYTGATIINQGILRLSGSGRIAVGAPLIINNGGELAMGRTDTWGGAGTTAASTPNITINTGGVLSSNGNFNTLWNLNLNGGTLNANGGANSTFPAFQLMGTVRVTEDSSIIGGGTNSSINTAAIYDVTGGKLLTVSARLRGSNGGLGEAAGTVTKNGFGNLSLLAANTYIGGTTLNSGGILIGNNAALGTGTLTFAGANGRLSSDGLTARTLANNIVLTNDAIMGDSVNTGALQLNGTVTASTTRLVTAMSDVTFAGAVTGTGSLRKQGLGALTLGGTNTLTGSLQLISGKLTLDYSTNDTTKLAGALILQGGSLELTGGTFAQTVTATTLNGNVDLTRATGTATLALGTLTRGTAGLLNIVGTGFVTTSSANVNGVLRGVLVDGGLAANDGAGNIIAATAFTDVARLGGLVGNVSTANMRITDTGNTTGNMTVGAGVTTINTLTNSTATAATVTIGTGNTLRLSSVGTVIAGVGLNLTGGTLTAGDTIDTAGVVQFVSGPTGTSTISSVIANNGTGTVSLTKSGAGTLILSGASTFTGTTFVQQGILVVNNDAFWSAYRVESGATLQLGINGNNSGYQPGITVLGAGADATSGLQIQAGRTYRMNGLNLENAATTIRNYGGATAAAIQGHDSGSIHMTVSAAASGSVVDTLVNFNMGSFGYRMNVLAGVNTSVADLHIRSALTGSGSGGGFFKDGDGSIKLTGDSTTQGLTSFKIRGGSVILAGGSNRLGAINFQFSNASKLVLGDSAAVSNQAMTTLTSVSTTSIVGGNLTSNSALTLNFSTNQTYAGRFGGVIAGENNLNVIKSGAGILTLAQASSYAGGTTLSAGGITLGNAAALGTGGVILTAGTLDLGGFTINNTVAISGGTLSNGSLASGLLSGSAGTVSAVLTGNTGLAKTGTGNLSLNAVNTFSGNVSIAAGGTLQVGLAGVLGNFSLTDTITNSGNLLFASTAQQTVNAVVSGAGSLTQSGSGTVTLANANTYSGATSISAGTLSLSNAAALGTSTVTVSSTGTLNQGGLTTTNDLILTGGTITGGTLASTNLNTTAFGTVDSVLTGTSGFTKSGTGRLILNGQNTFTGATVVTAGTLSVNGALAGGATINTEAILGGNGAILGTLAVSSGGRLAPGNSVGLLTVNDASFSGGSFFDWELNNTGTAAGTGYDQLFVLGDLSLAGLSSTNRLTLKLISLTLPGDNVAGAAGVFDQGQSFSLAFIRYGTLNLGTNTNLSDLFTYDTTQLLDQNGLAVAGTFSVSDVGNGLNLVYTAPIPEPSTYGLVLGFLTLAAVAIRRRKAAKVSCG